MIPVTSPENTREVDLPELFGRRLSRTGLERCGGYLSQFGGVRLLVSDNCPSRGVRLVEFRTGTGFSFEVAVDREIEAFRAQI
jgi:hypothetical protein